MMQIKMISIQNYSWIRKLLIARVLLFNVPQSIYSRLKTTGRSIRKPVIHMSRTNLSHDIAIYLTRLLPEVPVSFSVLVNVIHSELNSPLPPIIPSLVCSTHARHLAGSFDLTSGLHPAVIFIVVTTIISFTCCTAYSSTQSLGMSPYQTFLCGWL